MQDRLTQEQRDLMMLFIRATEFYPVVAMSPSECGKTVAEQAAHHAEINPGTVRVEDMDGTVLWRCDQ